MFCSNCGAEASGRFCWSCGAPLHSTETGAPAAQAQAPANGGWDALLRRPDVRERVEAAARRAAKPMSADEFLKTFGKLVPGPLPVASLASVVQPIYAQLGIGTGKERTELFPPPREEVFVGVVCSLAAGGNELVRVLPAADGYFIEATIPSDMFSFQGALFVTARSADGDATAVDAETKIKGQLFDWGKSRRVLDGFFAGIRDFARLPS